MKKSIFENAKQQNQPGYLLRGLLLGGNPKISEGIYLLDHWAVRLGDEGHADEAHMASLHEMYHATLNDSTAFGALMHVAGLFYSVYPEESVWLNFLEGIFEKAIHCHESFATYASIFIVCNGVPQKQLLNFYPDYQVFWNNAISIVKKLPNNLLGLQLIQSVCRVCMQANCLTHFSDKPPSAWKLSELPRTDLPDQRFFFLLDSGFAETIYSSLQEWAKNQDEKIRWLVNIKHDDQELYLQMINPEFDDVNDRISLWFYDHFAEYIRKSGASCLEYNGHQELVKNFIHYAQNYLPNNPSQRRLQSAPYGNQDEAQVILNFAKERLVITSEPYEAIFYNLNDFPEDEWAKLFTGPEKHGFIAVRPTKKMLRMYNFQKTDRKLIERYENLVYLRRRFLDPDSGIVVVEHFLIESVEVLSRLSNLRTTEVFFVASCSMLCLADKKWQREWIPMLRKFAELTVLVDMNPFMQIQFWQHQGEFDIFYSSFNLEDSGKRHVVFVLFPETGDDLLYFIPCTGLFVKALTYWLQSVFPSHRLRNDIKFLQSRQKLAVYVSSHLLKEEPWFDFLAEVN